MIINSGINSSNIGTSGAQSGGSISTGGGAGGAMAYGAIASGVISGIGNIMLNNINAKRAKNQYDFQARMSEIQGRMVRLAADVQIKQIRNKALSMFSTQRAAYAKAGVKMSGSPAEVMADSLKNSEMQAIFTDINATYNLGNIQMGADMDRFYGSQQKGIANMNNARTLLNVGTKAMTQLSFASQGGK